MLKWIKLLFHNCKFEEQLGYGFAGRLGLGTYKYKQCQTCGKLKNGVYDFERDPEMYEPISKKKEKS